MREHGERRVKARLTATLAALVLLAPTVAATQNDALTGGDAGDTRASAALLPQPGSYGASFTGSDVDWYRMGTGTPAPVCATATVTSGPSSRLSLFAGDKAVHARSATSAHPSVSLALVSASEIQTRHESLATPGGDYGFTLSLQAAPARSLGDALTGADAGATLSSAILVGTGCLGGRLSTLDNLADTVDVYAVRLVAGQEFAYSLASDPAAGLRLGILDSAGVAVGTSTTSGDVRSFVPQQDGLYYMTVGASGSSIHDAAYVIGTTTGPPDPGNPCRPQC